MVKGVIRIQFHPYLIRIHPYHGDGQCVLAVRVGLAQRGPPHGPLALLIMDRIAGGKVSE